MKNKFMLLAAGLTAALTLATCVHADFAKSKDYTDGMFTDVPSGEWYAASVKDAYEYGIMQATAAPPSARTAHSRLRRVSPLPRVSMKT